MKTPKDAPSADERELMQAGYRFALSLSHDAHEAEDLVQQACFRVISKKGRLASRAYLLTTIRNLFYDAMRRRKLITFEPIDALQEPSREFEAPIPHRDHFGAKMDLEVQLSRLEPEEREAIYLNYIEGYTAAELANMWSRPRSTILNILSRAKARLAAFEDKAQDPSPHQSTN